jgi:Mycothiol maleylpyruvate isomerase N-terminal domain
MSEVDQPAPQRAPVQRAPVQRTAVQRTAVQDALEAAYQNVTAAADSLGEAELMLPSRCVGWAVTDVLYHQLLDARRALRAFASPASGPADVDDVTYWRHYSPQDGEAGLRASAEAAAHARHVRIAASAYPPGDLAWDWRETSAAACRAARACPHQAVTTQGLVLATADFIATLAVESAVHYLDMTVALPAAPDPDPASLALVRRTLDGLLGAAMPADWDDINYALKGTGRTALSESDRDIIGSLADRLPLIG